MSTASQGKLVGSRGDAFRKASTSKPDEWRDKSGLDVGAKRNTAHEKAAVEKAEEQKRKREREQVARTLAAQQRSKETLRMAREETGTDARVKIRNLARPDDPIPTSPKSKLSKQAEIKTKVIDEERPMTNPKTDFGLPADLINSARSILEKKHNNDDEDDKVKGKNSQVDLDPETNDDVNDDDDNDDDMKKESKHTTPKTSREKKLAALASPKDKITHKDVLVGRGVLKKEEVELGESYHKYKMSYEKGGWDPEHRVVNTHLDLTKSPEYKAGEDILSPQRMKKLVHAHPDHKKMKERGYRASKYGEHGESKFGKTINESLDIDSLTEEQLEEVLKKSDPAGKWVSDFVHSKDPKFAGKSKKERMKMALGAYYAKQRNEEVEEVDEAIKPYVSYSAGGMGKSPSATVMAANEKPHKTFTKTEHGHDYKQKAMDYFKRYGNKLKEEEQLDELSPETLKSYQKGAQTDISKTTKGIAQVKKIYKSFGSKPNVSGSMKHIEKRSKGIELAKAKTGEPSKTTAKVLSKEELENIEAIAAQLDEAKPTVVSAPVRGPNQDQSGFGVKKSVADYTISDSKKMKVKEEVELDEARGRPKKSGEAPEGDDTAKHPIQQLTKIAHAVQGNEPHFEHKDGSKTKVTRMLARHITTAYHGMRTSQEKDDFAKKLHASRDSMMAAVKKHT